MLGLKLAGGGSDVAGNVARCRGGVTCEVVGAGAGASVGGGAAGVVVAVGAGFEAGARDETRARVAGAGGTASGIAGVVLPRSPISRTTPSTLEIHSFSSSSSPS